MRGERNLPCGHPGCDAIFDTPQGRGCHRRTHQPQACEWCAGTFTGLSIGAHRTHCPKRSTS